MNPVQKRRKPANSKKGSIAKCKAPDKNNPSGICNKPYMVNKDRLRDHKYCSHACKSRAAYHNKKKKLNKLKKDMKKLGVSNEVDLMTTKDRFIKLDEIKHYLNNLPLNSFFSGADRNLMIATEQLLHLCAEYYSRPISDKFKYALNETKKDVLQIKPITDYLKEKEAQERKGPNPSWSMTVSSIPNYMSIHWMDLLTNRK